MTITVNQNDNTVAIDNGKRPIVFDRLKDTYQIKQILDELFNALSLDGDYSGDLNITLEWIDEDTRTIIGEW